MVTPSILSAVQLDKVIVTIIAIVADRIVRENQVSMIVLAKWSSPKEYSFTVLHFFLNAVSEFILIKGRVPVRPTDNLCGIGLVLEQIAEIKLVSDPNPFEPFISQGVDKVSYDSLLGYVVAFLAEKSDQIGKF